MRRFVGKLKSVKARTIIAVLIVGAIAALFSVSTTITYPLLQHNEAVLMQFDENKLSAKAVFVAGVDGGEPIFSRNVDTEYPIASVTKLFTAYAAQQSSRIDDSTLIVWQDFVTEGTAGSLWLGEEYTLRQLLFPLLLSSSNDAGAAIYRVLGDKMFTEELSQLYADAGLTHTRIVDTTGLTAKNHSTARELATFIAFLSANSRYLLDITELHSYVGPHHYGWINNDPARKFDSFRGGKHGYTPEAGRTFAGIFVGDDGKDYIVVLLGSNDLSADLTEILKVLPRNVTWSAP